MSDALPLIQLQVHPVSLPTDHAGWFLGFGYGQKPMVLYAVKGQTVWRDGVRFVGITHYAGPLPERPVA